jgi:hypothetical protein
MHLLKLSRLLCGSLVLNYGDEPMTLNAILERFPTVP